LLRWAVSDSAANLFPFVPALGTREALAFGAGIPLPMRLTFAELPPHLLPRSDVFAGHGGAEAGGEDVNFIAAVVERWRSATMRNRGAGGGGGADEAPRDLRLLGTTEATPTQPATDPGRFGLLRKPLTDRPDPYAALRAAPPRK
jgi:hypothetical protein